MQSVSSRIWTRVAVSISYDDNHYTTGTSIFYIVYFMLCLSESKRGEYSFKIFGLSQAFNDFCCLQYFFDAVLVLKFF